MGKRTTAEKVTPLLKVAVPVLDVSGGGDLPTIDPPTLERLSVEYARTRDPQLRDHLILYHQRLVRSIVSRFVGSGEMVEDLVQVGNIGLINALDRFDPDQGTRFSTYATPTILGEIKRHFRDKTPGIKVPRWLQELHYSARRAAQHLTGKMGRSPTVAELAAHLNVDEEDVLEALESGEAMNLLSLDTALDEHKSSTGTLQDMIGEKDAALNELLVFSDLREALEILDSREREVISLRFFGDLSQSRIAAQLNISQMHVSRLQQRALRRLRDLLSEDGKRGKKSGGRRGRKAESS